MAEAKKAMEKDKMPQNLDEALAMIQEQKNKIRKLELRKAQYDSILENMTELVERSAPDYSLLYVNDAMCELYECNPEDFLGRNTLDLLFPEERGPVDEMTKRRTPADPSYKYEYQVRKKDGSIIWIESNGRGFYDEEGNIIEYQEVGRDVTHFKNMEEELTRKVQERTRELKTANEELLQVNAYLESILQGISESIVIVKSDGGSEFLNFGPNDIWKSDEHNLCHYFKGLILSEKSNVLRKLLSRRQAFTDVEMYCRGRSGELTFLVSGVPFSVEDAPDSRGILVLKPMTQVHKMINRMSGATARFRFSDIVTNSTILQDAIGLAKQGASSDCTILIEGESGTGKEMFAQSIHNNSARRSGPFVAVNCGAIPRELVASELFGYVEGAFTGAKKGGKPGKFELANGGTLFLDEIGDMPMEQQIALLRVLQERRVTRVGGEREIPVDVRIICATHRNLLNEVNQKNFREDLYYRLNVINFHIPPLRKRKEDILLLFSTFLKRSQPSEKILQKINPDVLDALVRYDWPGNVRELQNVAERILYLLAEGKDILPQFLPSHILEYAPKESKSLPTVNVDFSTAAPAGSLADVRREKKKQKMTADRAKIMAALHAAGGNVTLAARSLNISRATFYRRYHALEREEG